MEKFWIDKFQTYDTDRSLAIDFLEFLKLESDEEMKLVHEYSLGFKQLALSSTSNNSTCYRVTGWPFGKKYEIRVRSVHKDRKDSKQKATHGDV